ncbi:MAG: hypothetical protein ACFFD8_08150, partial [Candidatus Thorarchaeota archaeon]
MSTDPFVRTPAIITDINAVTSNSTGTRVRVMGFVVDHQDQSGFILSDDTGPYGIANIMIYVGNNIGQA